MDTIFTLPLFFLALFQALIALTLVGPKQVALFTGKLYVSARKNAATNSVVMTFAVVLGGLLVSCMTQLVHNYERAVRADVREVVTTIDYLRAQVSCVLCALNLLLLFLTRALADSLCAADSTTKNLEAMKRQVKGLQTEYERVTSSGNNSSSSKDTPASGDNGEVTALKKQLDKVIAEKNSMQATLDDALKTKSTADASVRAMKSQMQGFDAEFTRLLEENKLLKRKLTGFGDKTYASEVQQAMGSSRKDD